MNAQHEIDRLLEESGAVLVRQNKHLVYRLPNGKNFVAAKTSSDPDRAARNSLSELRRALGIVREMPEPKGGSEMPAEQAAPVVPAPQERALAPKVQEEPGTPAPAAPAAQERPVRESLKDRIEVAIARQEAEQETLLAAAQKVERRVQMLKALLPFSDDPATAEVLRVVLPEVEPRAARGPRPEARPEPPQYITEPVQVTRQLVFAATQTFDDTFTVNDVLTLMTGSRPIDPAERRRVRSLIAQAMISLHQRGELIRETEGRGKQQAIWRKATLDGNGNGVGTRA